MSTSIRIQGKTLTERASRSRLTPPDWALMAFGVVLVLAVSLRFAAHRILWEDEILGWMLLKDPSWRHMVHAWVIGADGGGFSFYLTGRLWFALFGASVTSFRLYSATCFGAAFALTWAAARSVYSVGVVTWALFTLWFLSPPIIAHAAEGRFYGLLMAAAAFAVYVFVRGLETTRPCGRSLLWLGFLAHGLLVTSHILGVVYSFFLIAATVAEDALRGNLRPRLYASELAAWLLLLPCIPAIRASAQVGKPRFWTVQPNLQLFLVAYSGFSLRIAALLLVLLAGCVLRVFLGKQRRSTFTGMQSRRPMYILLAALFLVPVAFYLEGTVGPSLFIDRYLVPINIGVALLIAELTTVIDFAGLLSPRLRVPAFAILIVLAAVNLVSYDFFYLPKSAGQHFDYTGQLTALLPKGVPVVCEDMPCFTEIMSREAASGVEYTYLLDPDYAFSAKAGGGAPTHYHLMENWKRAGYFSSSIYTRREFLQRYSEFLILRTEEMTPATLLRASRSTPRTRLLGTPFWEQFSGDPAYKVVPYRTMTFGRMRFSMYLVCRAQLPCDPTSLPPGKRARSSSP